MDIVKKKRSNRNAGHNYERTTVLKFRELGFPHVVTSRSESKSRDDDKIDLMNKDESINGRLPYNIQCKNSCKLIDYIKIFNGTTKLTVIKRTGNKERVVVKPMPKVPGVINVILHKSTNNKAKTNTTGKFMPTGHFAILSQEDFFSMVKELQEYRSGNTANITVVKRNTDVGEIGKTNL